MGKREKQRKHKAEKEILQIGDNKYIQYTGDKIAFRVAIIVKFLILKGMHHWVKHPIFTSMIKP